MGSHGNYSPFIWVTDFSSLGTCDRPPSIRFERVRPHQFLSTLEVLFFFCVESLICYDDFQEQYYLPLEETLAIAEQLGVPHPKSSKNIPWLMTTDAVITLNQDGQKVRYARTIKLSKQLTERNVAKFAIEREFWVKRYVDWGIVTERDIPEPFARNWAWLRNKYELPDITQDVIRTVGEVLLGLIKGREASLSSLTMQTDTRLGLELVEGH